MISSLSWTDADGAASLTNDKPEVATRFADWVVHRKPVGPSSVALGTGRTAVFEFRESKTASFSIVGIPETEMEKMIRLQYHLLNGYIIGLAGDRAMASDFALCTLAPGTEPEISQSDPAVREYTMSFVVQPIAEADVPEDELFYPPGDGGGSSLCEDPENEIDADSFYGDSFQDWPLGEVDPSLWGSGTYYSTDPEGVHAARHAMLSPDPWAYIENNFGDIDGVPEDPNISIECSTMNGVNVHAMRQTKSAGDTRSIYGVFAFMRRRIPGTALGGSDFDLDFDNQWTSMRIRFSNGFMFRGDDPLEQEYIWLLESEGISYPDSELSDGDLLRTIYWAHLVTGYDQNAGNPIGGFDYPLTGGLEVMQSALTQRFSGGTLPKQFNRAEIISAAELMSGNPFRIVTHSYHDTSDAPNPGWRFKVWKGNAFGGALTLAYNNIMYYGSQFAPIDRLHITHVAENQLYSVPDTGSQYFEFTHPEWADGQVHANPYGVP